MSARGSSSPELSSDLAAVVIGRNEGDRLLKCLQSVEPQIARVVYVDSGSVDGSVALARQRGADVVELAPSRPFTAARGRNAGVRLLCSGSSAPRFVQVIDGDCVLEDQWVEAALARFDADPRLGIVCGRRREEFPGASRYNQLCDMEWDTPIGEVNACGGDAMIRVEAFAEVGGYAEHLIAGEDPEFSHRVRRAGWTILRIDAPMTCHDARIERLAQWWTRSVRAGHAYAECCMLHRGEGGFRVRQLLSILAWGGLLPMAALAAAVPSSGLGLGLLPLGLAFLWLRILRSRIRGGDPVALARRYASFCVIGKTAQFQGVLRYLRRVMLRRTGELIEYRAVPPPARSSRR